MCIKISINQFQCLIRFTLSSSVGLLSVIRIFYCGGKVVMVCKSKQMQFEANEHFPKLGRFGTEILKVDLLFLSNSFIIK